MLIGTVEHNAKAALLSLVEDIHNQNALAWGLVAIERSHLKDMTNDALMLAIKPALQEVTRAKIFFMENDTVCVTWFGMPRQTYQKLMSVCRPLVRTGVTETIEKIVAYLDPLVMAEELNVLLNPKKNGVQSDLRGDAKMALRQAANHTWPENVAFFITSEQTDQFQKLVAGRAVRDRLNILIVEDQSFLRNLLAEVLRTDYAIETAADLKEGWNLYVKKAPDIVFLDIQLPDGSGHALAHRIKELDPASYIVMVTASNQRDDVELAKENHVDGFIIKPFNKKKISDCIDYYLVSRNISPKKKNLI